MSRSVQEQGQFIIVFPRSYTSSICTGYSVAESVYFAPRDYLHFAENEFQNIRDSNEPMMFPLSKLMLSIATGAHRDASRKKTLKIVKPLLEKIRDYEYIKRTMISDMGVKSSERINLRNKKKQEEDDEYECETCSANLYVSFVSVSTCSPRSWGKKVLCTCRNMLKIRFFFGKEEVHLKIFLKHLFPQLQGYDRFSKNCH